MSSDNMINKVKENKFIIVAKLPSEIQLDFSSTSIAAILKDVYFEEKDENNISRLSQFENCAKRFNNSKEAHDFLISLKGIQYLKTIFNNFLLLREIEEKRV